MSLRYKSTEDTHKRKLRQMKHDKPYRHQVYMEQSLLTFLVNEKGLCDDIICSIVEYIVFPKKSLHHEFYVFYKNYETITYLNHIRLFLLRYRKISSGKKIHVHPSYIDKNHQTIMLHETISDQHLAIHNLQEHQPMFRKYNHTKGFRITENKKKEWRHIFEKYNFKMTYRKGLRTSTVNRLFMNIHQVYRDDSLRFVKKQLKNNRIKVNHEKKHLLVNAFMKM